MTLPTVLLSAGAGGLVAAITLILVGGSAGPDPTVAADREQRLARLEQLLQTTANREDPVAARVAELAERLARIEARSQREPAAVTAVPPPPAEPVPADTEAAADLPRAEFTALLAKVLRSSHDGTATADEQERFWRAARTTGLVDDTIAALEATAHRDAADAGARMQLADAYVAKLLTVPFGPERGIWGMKAEAEWQAVIDRDPQHWDAQYALAYSHSMYPDFLNKTDDAITGFERALEIQLTQQTAPQHAKTYVHLARMHQKKGDIAKAREVLEAGRIRHPRDTDLERALRALPAK